MTWQTDEATAAAAAAADMRRAMGQAVASEDDRLLKAAAAAYQVLIQTATTLGPAAAGTSDGETPLDQLHARRTARAAAAQGRTQAG